MERSELEEIGKRIITSAIKVHQTLGPGLLESAYQKCLAYELQLLGVKVECEVPVPIRYGAILIETGYRLDMLIEGSVIVENKTVETILPIHEAQLLTYLRLKDIRLGYLLNWHVHLMKDGIRRFVNNL